MCWNVCYAIKGKGVEMCVSKEKSVEMYAML